MKILRSLGLWIGAPLLLLLALSLIPNRDFRTTYTIPLGMALVGALWGTGISIFFTRQHARREFQKERADLLQALLDSMRENLVYLHQINNVHFAQGELPSFPLDTVALSHIALRARRYLPMGAKWGERYNKLRFEMDHVNRKVLMVYIKPTVKDFNGLKFLIGTTTTLLQEEIAVLERTAKGLK